MLSLTPLCLDARWRPLQSLCTINTPLPLIYTPIYSKPAVSGELTHLGKFTHSKKLSVTKLFLTISRAIVIIAAASSRNTPAWYGNDLRLSLSQSGHSGRARTKSERGWSITGPKLRRSHQIQKPSPFAGNYLALIIIRSKSGS